MIEQRLDGTLAIRFRDKYLNYEEIAVRGAALGGAAPQTPRSLAPGGPTSGAEKDPASGEAGSADVQPTGGRSGRTPAEPYPPDGGEDPTKKGPWRPAADHPWRKPFKRPK